MFMFRYGLPVFRLSVIALFGLSLSLAWGYEYDESDPEAGAVQEVFGVLSNADQGGYRRGHDEGHVNGWEDHGRERGCDSS